MLSSDHRLHRSSDFTDVVRRGRRASRTLLTVHCLLDPAGGDTPPRAGLVVSKAVGGSVVRHRTARRLRHLLRGRVGFLPPGSRVVVRASAASGSATSTALALDLDGALASAVRDRARR